MSATHLSVDTLAEFDAAQAALKVTPTVELLRKKDALTHRIHPRGPGWRDLRAQRDMIDAEILRRVAA